MQGANVQNQADKAFDPVPVLVVEDEILLQQLIETVLMEAGFEITLAFSGAEALALLGHNATVFRALCNGH